MTNTLRPWQSRAVANLAQGGILAHSTGLGKSRTIIETINRALGPSLIVCPALVKDHWAAEIGKWAPVCTVKLISSKKEAVGLQECTHINIISPELLGSLPTHKWRWLVLDEAHEYKTAGAKRTQNVREHRKFAAACLAATATPVSREIDDLWQLLSLVQPGKWGGNIWAFRNRYMVVKKQIANGVTYGSYAEGVRPDRVAELADRLRRVVHIALHDDPEIAPFLPPLSVETEWLPPGDVWAGEWTGEALSAWMASQRAAKIAAVERIAAEARGPICVLTHLRETAEECAEAIGGVVAHGGSVIKARLRKANTAALDGQHLCTTLHALGVGIDLVKFKTAVFAELHWVPRTIIQAMGRFRRLSSDDKGVAIRFVCQRGTADEQMRLVLQRRMEEQAKIMKTGGIAARLMDQLSPLSEAAALAELRKVASSMRQTDEYLDFEGGDE